MPTTHAILAPSAAKRWMTCAPSARLEAQVPGKDTAYTKEGTIAHAMAEVLLRICLDQDTAPIDDFVDKFQVSYNALKEKGGKRAPLYMELADHVDEAFAEGLDPWEMLSTVLDYYCRPVFDDFLQARAQDPEAILLVEQKLNLGEYIPEGFGSSDAVLIYGSTLAVYDLKYGKGVKVSAHENPQMMCYALGAILGPGELYDLHEVKMTIIQPRLQWISTYESTYWDLLKWATEELRPAAVLAYQGGGDFVPGDHCRFCNVAPRCKALAEKALTLNANRSDAALMNNDELAAALQSVTAIKSWIAGLETYAMEQIKAGQTIPGFKVVEGRSLRQISDQQAAMRVLQDAGFAEDSYVKPRELKTISDLEKLLKKKGFQELLGQYVVKPQGKPTLAPEDDPRPAMNSASSAMDDFKDIN